MLNKTTPKPFGYKAVCYTPKGEVAEAIYNYCVHQGGYDFLIENPQDLIRKALRWTGLLLEKQPNFGNYSTWERGASIKTSFWIQNLQALDDTCTKRGIKRQQLIEEAVLEYLAVYPIYTHSEAEFRNLPTQ